MIYTPDRLMLGPIAIEGIAGTEAGMAMVAAALGWVGTTGTFLAYLLLWRGRVGSESPSYALMNAVGGFLGGAASVLYGAWPSAASNFVWAAVGVHSVVATLRARSERRGCARPSAVEAVTDCLA